MKQLTISIFLVVLFVNALAQNNSDDFYANLYPNKTLNYRASTTPLTFCSLKKGDLKLNYTNEAQPNFKDYKSTRENRFPKSLVNGTLSYLTEMGNSSIRRVNLGYGVTDHIVVLADYHRLSRRWENYFIPAYEIKFITYESTAHAFSVGAVYHNTLPYSLSYEFGSNLTLGKGRYEFRETISFLLPDAISVLSYNSFVHNFVSSLSFGYKKWQVTAQVNMGYLKHYNLNYSSPAPITYEEIVKHFYAHQTDFYIDPALIVNINFRRLGLQAHIRLPYTFGESKISKPTPTIGIGLSYKILQNRQKTEGLVVQP
ncbi:MAG: hypothetical protein WC951_11255 [Bacteroidales bacterium]|nr:hypothetical protein [Tenuifilaceae bacterium]